MAFSSFANESVPAPRPIPQMPRPGISPSFFLPYLVVHFLIFQHETLHAGSTRPPSGHGGFPRFLSTPKRPPRVRHTLALLHDIPRFLFFVFLCHTLYYISLPYPYLLPFPCGIIYIPSVVPVCPYPLPSPFPLPPPPSPKLLPSPPLPLSHSLPASLPGTVYGHGVGLRRRHGPRRCLRRRRLGETTRGQRPFLHGRHRTPTCRAGTIYRSTPR